MNKYSILLKQEGTADSPANSVELEFENHDDLFRIIDKLKLSGHFSNDDEAIQFAIGLKMFSAVMMKHRDEELFKDFEPSFIGFMKKLKGAKH